MNDAATMSCPGCDAPALPQPVHVGAIRHGKFGNSIEGRVLGCHRCGLQWLDVSSAPPTDYVSDAYRVLVGEDAEADTFFRLHDDEQFEKIPLLQGLLHRGMTVADVGCGGGSFLDFVRGVAGTTVGIEPAVSYHDSLRTRGHRVAASADAAVAAGLQADLVTCFSVIEHVADPIALLRDMHTIAKPGASLLISTPNLADVLMEAVPDAYPAFFYRAVHLLYFNERALRQACTRASLDVVAVRFHHRFGLGNFLGWYREGRPTGRATLSWVDAALDASWRQELERRGRSDYLYVVARRRPESGQ